MGLRLSGARRKESDQRREVGFKIAWCWCMVKIGSNGGSVVWEEERLVRLSIKTDTQEELHRPFQQSSLLLKRENLTLYSIL